MPREPARRGAARRLASGVGGRALDALLATCRWHRDGAEHFQALWERGRPVIFVLWHGRLLPCTYRHRGQGLVTLISRHRDGDLIAGVVEGRWGYRAVRGSSSRGATHALRELLRAVRGGRSVAITPDGPRGPREQMKMGPVLLAQRTGAPLIPVASGADRAWWFGGWDRFLVPKPFARLRIRYGAPIEVPRTADADALEAVRLRTEIALRELREKVDREAKAG